MEVYLYVAGPVIVASIAIALISYALENALAIRRWRLTVGVVLLGLICLWIASLSSSEYLGLLGFIGGFLTIGLSIIGGFFMLTALPKRRKPIALLVGVMFPLLIWTSFSTGWGNSPTQMTRRESKVIVQALKTYYADNHSYPASLEELVPKYLEVLPDEPQTPGGWLYKVMNGDFALGYVGGVEKFGYWVCFYSAEATDWDCPPPTFDAKPFGLGPTPLPTKIKTR